MRVGFGREDITLYEPGMCMMGWGRPDHIVEGVGERLQARAVYVEGAEDRWVFVALDLLVVTQGLWLGVIDALQEHALGLDARNVVLVATHTHSGPSGYGHHFWINLTTPGFAGGLYDALVARVVDAILQAVRTAETGRLRWSTAVSPLSDGIVFNRSWFAYNRNHDVTPVTEARRDEATDRRHVVLSFEGDAGTRGVVDWFGLHGTCVHADHRLLHPDHKGLAAMAYEARGWHAVFAQECCGDVSPNFRWDPARGHTRGPCNDDYDSAAYVAASQVRRVDEMLDSGEDIGVVEVASTFVDFSGATADAAFVHDGRPRRTRPARLGVSMTMGTAEGPGPLLSLPAVVGWVNRLAGLRDPEDPKYPLLDLGSGAGSRVAGMLPVSWAPPVDPVVGWIGRQVRSGAASSDAWVPQVLPVQAIRLGGLLVLAFPFETTTVAGRRLRATALAHAPEGVREVVISTYANAYVGYLTTFEEYQLQHYEAGYTLFGPHSLAALRTVVASLVTQLGARTMTGTPPARVPRDHVERIPFRDPWVRTPAALTSGGTEPPSAPPSAGTTT